MSAFTKKPVAYHTCRVTAWCIGGGWILTVFLTIISFLGEGGHPPVGAFLWLYMMMATFALSILGVIAGFVALAPFNHGPAFSWCLPVHGALLLLAVLAIVSFKYAA